MTTLTFPKQEKLCGKLSIANLYEKGRRFTCYPLRVTYLFCDGADSQEVKVLVWAAKSLFRRATRRNRLRRLMREAYRLNAQPLREYCQKQQKSLHIAFNYISKEELDLWQMEKAVRKSIEKISEVETVD